MQSRPTIGVLIPTRNCAGAVTTHVAAMRSWLDLADHIVVVDSLSTDNTVPLLRAQLEGRNLSVLTHPPGLYPSWNFGIQHLRSQYAYISTLGDTIERAGLEHLVDTAQRLHADVVLSRPQFVSADGNTLGGRQWPIHDLLAKQPLVAPERITPFAAFLRTALAIPEGILGSSASNLYRTEHLQRYPFPTDYGHAGDTAWALRHARQTAWAVTPQTFSVFTAHAASNPVSSADTDRMIERLFAMALQVCVEEPTQPALAELAPWLERLAAATRQLARHKAQYRDYRHRRWPWILNPAAWTARSQSRRARAAQRSLRGEILARFGARPQAPQTPNAR